MRTYARAFASAWERYYTNRFYCAYANSVVRVLADPGSYSAGEKTEIKRATREIDAHLHRKRKVKK